MNGLTHSQVVSNLVHSRRQGFAPRIGEVRGIVVECCIRDELSIHALRKAVHYMVVLTCYAKLGHEGSSYSALQINCEVSTLHVF